MSKDDIAAQNEGPLFDDPSLSGDLEVGPIQATRLDSGKLRLQIPLNNVSGALLPVLVRVVFKDADGRALQGDETPWENVNLPVGAHNHWVTSLKQLASKYEVHLRRYRR